MASIPIQNAVTAQPAEREYVIGLDLGGTNLKYGIISNFGEIVYKNFVPAETQKGGRRVIDVMKQAAYECLMFSKKENFSIKAIGAGCPGTIDSVNGRSLGPAPHIVEWEGVEITKPLSEIARVPVFADNDANFMTYGETAWGAARGFRYVVGLTLGTGVGGGIVIDGSIYHGHLFNGAELGHVVVEADGRPCACGNHGCLEKYVGAHAIVRDIIDAIDHGTKSSIMELVQSKNDINPAWIFKAAELGDELCTRIVNQMIQYLGAGISSMVNVLSPEIVVIGGGMSDAGDDFIAKVREETLSRVMKPVKPHLKIVRAKLGNDAGIVGAGTWALKKT
ncbi:ROK family protein [bacterium]|nr:ROK family protein [bacterium]